jgi:hypothetical protein
VFSVRFYDAESSQCLFPWHQPPTDRSTALVGELAMLKTVLSVLYVTDERPGIGNYCVVAISFILAVWEEITC